MTISNFPKVTITDSSALKCLTPESIISYLERKGISRCPSADWRHSLGYKLSWIQGDEYRDEIIQVYMKTNLADYANGVSWVLKGLSQYEGRSELDIYYEILYPEKECILAVMEKS